jgi:acyl-CoA dehydrogenase
MQSNRGPPHDNSYPDDAAANPAQEVIDMAVQLFGGLSVVSGKAVETLYREIRTLRIYEGASEIQRLVIANEILKSFSDAS